MFSRLSYICICLLFLFSLFSIQSLATLRGTKKRSGRRAFAKLHSGRLQLSRRLDRSTSHARFLLGWYAPLIGYNKGKATWGEFNIFRDLTIRQRRRPWKRRLQMDPHPFTSLRFSQVAQLLKERNFGQKLEKGPRPSSLTEIIIFIALPSPFSSKLLQEFTFTKIYRKAWCTCRVVVLLMKPYCLVRFPLPSPP